MLLRLALRCDVMAAGCVPLGVYFITGLGLLQRNRCCCGWKVEKCHRPMFCSILNHIIHEFSPLHETMWVRHRRPLPEGKNGIAVRGIGAVLQTSSTRRRKFKFSVAFLIILRK